MTALLDYATMALVDKQPLPTTGYAVSGDAGGTSSFEAYQYTDPASIADKVGVILTTPVGSKPGFYARLLDHLPPGGNGIVNAEKLGFFPGPVSEKARDALGRAARDSKVREIRLLGGTHVLPTTTLGTPPTRHTPLEFDGAIGADLTGQGDTTVITWQGGDGFFSQVNPGGLLLRIVNCKQFAVRKLTIDAAANTDGTFNPGPLQTSTAENLAAATVRASDEVNLAECHFTNTWGVGVAIGYECGDVHVVRCKFSAIGRRAISVSWAKRVWITGCDISDCLTGLKIEPNVDQAVGEVVFKHNRMVEGPGRTIDSLSGSVHGGSYVGSVRILRNLFYIREPQSFHSYLLGMGSLEIARNKFISVDVPGAGAGAPLLTIGDRWWPVGSAEIVDNLVIGGNRPNWLELNARSADVEGNTIVGGVGPASLTVEDDLSVVLPGP